MGRKSASGRTRAVVLAVLGGVALPLLAGAQSRPVGFRKRTLALQSEMTSLLAVDLNGDGKLEVVTAADDEIAAYERGEGRGFWRKQTLSRRSPESGELAASRLAAYDVDADGKTDLVAAVPATGNLAWHRNPGSLQEGWDRYPIDTLPWLGSLALEDLNRDARPEIVAGSARGISWYLVPREPRGHVAVGARGETGRPAWDRRFLARPEAAGTRSLAFADMDGDGDRDLALPGAGALAWWERPADATLVWSRRLLRAEAPGATYLLPALVDGDGRLDLVYCRGASGGIGWLSGPDWQADHPIEDASLKELGALALGDLDGNGRTDVAAASLRERRALWWQNDGAGRFTLRELDTAAGGRDLQAVDLDGDGDLDLLLAGGEGTGLIWYENQRL